MRPSVLVSYALPAFVVALPTIPVYIVLPSLYGVELGLGLATTGLVLLGARLFDTVSDPLVGALSDQFAFRGNRRKPWIAVGAMVAGLGIYMVLNPPAGVGGVYLLLWSLVLYAGWTMVAVPYMAWGAELSAGYDERTRITAWREGVGLLGLFGAGAITAVATAAGWSERQSVGALAWVAIALGVVAFPLLLYRVPESRATGRSPAPVAGQQLKSAAIALRDNGPFIRLLAAWFLNGLANGIPAALFFLYLEYGLGADQTQRPLFVLVYFAAAVAAIPLWKAVSKRLGKHRAWCWAMAVACAAFITVPWIPQGAFAAFALVCAVTGAALGADLVLPPSIQADVVDYGAFRSGQARAGLLFALWGMSTKLALAVAVGFALPAVEAAGFDPAAPEDAGIFALSVIYALVPIVIKTTAIMLVWRFPLTSEKHAVIRRALDRRSVRQGDIKEAVL
jgi:GPH family glycoside/pentoside/hexuronide:cation symporter